MFYASPESTTSVMAPSNNLRDPGPGAPKLAPKHHAKLDLIIKYLHLDANLEETVQALASPVEAAWMTGNCIRHSSAEWELSTLWRSLLIVAKNLDYHEQGHMQTDLVDLLKALKREPEPEVPCEALAALDSEHSTLWLRAPLWQNLINYSFYVRQHIDGWYAWQPSKHSSSTKQVSLKQWLNFNSFLAQVTEADVLNHFDLGLACFVHGLEDEGGICTTQRGVTKRDVNVEVQTAAVWIFDAGRSIYEKAKKDGGSVVLQTVTKRKNPGRWRGALGIVDIHRWHLWKGMFACIEEYYCDLSKETTAMAKEAVEVIESIEAGE